MIEQGYLDNFNTLLRASDNGALCIVECTHSETGVPVITICAVQQDGENIEMIPVAKLFDGNPYKELIPPRVDL